MVALLPDGDVRIDVDEFRAAGRRGDRGAARRRPRRLALAEYGGPLLPDDVYEPWADEARESLRSVRVDLLRQAERWDDVLAEDPTDEAAHLALIRGHVDRGDVRAALRQFERLDHALLRELGTTPSPEAERLRARLHAPAGAQRPARAARASGSSAAAASATRSARRCRAPTRGAAPRCCSPGRPGSARPPCSGSPRRSPASATGAPVAAPRRPSEGPWPYAPVLEAFGELCRKHPALLDGLDDRFRHRDRAGPVRSRRQLDRRVQPPAAVRRRRRADAAGRDGTRAAARRRRPPGRRRGVAPAAALPVPLRRDRAGGDRGGAPAAGLRDRAAGGRESRTPRRRHPHRAGTARRRPPRVACSPTGSRTSRPTQVEEICAAQRRPAVLRPRAGRRPGRRRAACSPPLPARCPGDVPARGSARRRSSPPTSCSRSPTATRTRPTSSSRRRSRPASSSRRRPATGSGTRWCASDSSRRSRRPAGPWRGARSPNGSPRSADRPPGWPTCSSRPGLTSRAVPYALRAVETAGALGAYRDALDMIDAVRDHTGPDELPRLLVRRGDLLSALGDPEAVTAYQEAVAVTHGTEHRLVRARLARAAAFAGDLDIAREALDGLEVEGDAADGADPAGAGQHRVLRRRHRDRVGDRRPGSRAPAARRTTRGSSWT